MVAKKNSLHTRDVLWQLYHTFLEQRDKQK
jgi:hypothetical protein